MVQQVSQECKARVELKDRQVPLVSQAFKDFRVILALLGLWDQLVQWDHQAKQVLEAWLELQECKVLQASVDRPDNQDQLVILVTKDSLAYLVLLVQVLQWVNEENQVM